MNWQPEASLEILRLRAQWLKQVRAFFDARKVLEVETPVLSSASIPDPNIESLTVCLEEGSTAYLQTSPELYMKRLLAAGSGPVYQISRVFRQGESGRYHNPEFTLVEWYQPGFSQQQLMDEVAELVISICDLNRSEIQIHTISYCDLFEQLTGINPLISDWRNFKQYCESKQQQCPFDDDWNGAMDWLLATIIQPGMQGMVFVVDYPATQASLARLDPEDPSIARRFELFIDGVEMANGFEELTDVVEQRDRFEQENKARLRKGLKPVPLDECFLAALAAGMPETAGVALGLDRLLMWKTGSEKIQRVMSFAGLDNS